MFVYNKLEFGAGRFEFMARKQAVATAAAEVSDAPVLDTNNSKLKLSLRKVKVQAL